MILRLELLTEAERAHFEERAAVCEYDAKMTRQQAEAAAWAEVLRLRRQQTKKETA